MEMDDSDFSVVRKNLNIISVLILILAYTNAKLNSLSFLGIQIDLDAHKLYVALFILYGYFIWRFLTKLPLISGFWTDFLRYYLESERGLKSRYKYETYKEVLIAKSDRLRLSIKEDPNLRVVTTSLTRSSSRQILNLRLSFTFYTIVPQDRGVHPNFTVDHNIKISVFLFLRKLLVFSFRYDKFGDYLFPIFPIVVNMCFFLFASSWQGSLCSLWLN